MILKGNYSRRQIMLDGKELKPERSKMVFNHSPDGFSWGYDGSGSAQLALAVMLEYFDRTMALKLYQKFQQEIIANLPEMDFEFTFDIQKWIGK